MTAIKKLTDSSGVQYFPQTHTKAVVDDNGYSVESRMQAVQDVVNQAQMEIGAVPSDLAPTENSTNWVTSGGVYNAVGEVKKELFSELDIPISSIPSYSGYAIYATTNKWYKRNDLKYLLLSVSEGDVIKFKGNATNPTQYAYLHSDTVVDGSTPDYTPNTTIYTLGLGEEKDVVISSGTAYLYFTQTFNSDRTPEYVKKDVSIKEAFSEVDSKINGIEEEISETNDRLSECELAQKNMEAYFVNVEEEGLYFVDKNLHVGAKIDSTGFHAININEE